VITIFPTDLPGEEPTDVGRYHLILAAIAFTSIAVAAGVFHTTVEHDPFWKPHIGLLAGLGYLVIAAAVGTALTRRVVLTRWFGVVERLLYVAMLAWLGAVAVILVSG